MSVAANFAEVLVAMLLDSQELPPSAARPPARQQCEFLFADVHGIAEGKKSQW